MTQYEDIHDALESTALPAKRRTPAMLTEASDIAQPEDIIIWRDRLMTFLDEICDDSLSVRDVREALDAYPDRGEVE